MGRGRSASPLLLFFSVLPAATLLADRVTLSSGGRLEGDILEETPRTLLLKSSQGILEIPRNRVAGVERNASRTPEVWMLPARETAELIQAPSPERSDATARLEAALPCFDRFESGPEAEQAASGLIALGPSLLPAVLEHLQGLTAPRQKWMIDVLRLIGDPAAVDPLMGLTRSPSAEVRAASAQALASLRDPRAEEALILLLKDPEALVRRQACASLQALGRPKAIAPLIALLSDPVLPVRASARDALAGLTGESLPADPAPWKAWLERHPPQEETGGRTEDPGTARGVPDFQPPSLPEPSEPEEAGEEEP